MSDGRGPTLAERLARRVVELDAAQLPARAVEVARLQVLDQLGVQLLGSTLPNVAPVRELVAALGARPESTVVGSATGTAAAYAAFVNGTLASSCEFDDAHMAASHPGSYVVPTALALGESTGASGREVLAAVVGGVQVMALLGSAALRSIMANGWHVAKILGTFGAAAAAGRLLGLDAGRLAHALAIVGSDAAGTVESEFSGGEVKRMHAGSAGRNGVQAAQLARAGFTGPLTVVEGDHGIFRIFGTDVDATAADRAWDRVHVIDTIFRLCPTIGSAAPALDGVRHLVREHAPDPREIRAIRLGLPAFAVGGARAVMRPTDTVSAQFSTAFSVALLLMRGRNRPADYFDPALRTDPEVLALVDRTVPYEYAFVPEQPALSCRIDLELADGRVLSHTQRGFRGHPDSPETDDRDVEAKFHDNADDVVGAATARRIRELVAKLDAQDGVRELMALTAPAG